MVLVCWFPNTENVVRDSSSLSAGNDKAPRRTQQSQLSKFFKRISAVYPDDTNTRAGKTYLFGGLCSAITGGCEMRQVGPIWKVVDGGVWEFGPDRRENDITTLKYRPVIICSMWRAIVKAQLG